MTDSRHAAILDALKRGEVVVAESLCDAFLRAGGGAEGVYLMGAIQSLKGDKRAAARLIGRAATLLPGRADIAYNNGVALREIGDIAAAAAEWRRTLAIEPEHRDAQGNLALALDQVGDMVGAVEVYGRLLDRRPDDRDALYNFANLCQRAGEIAAAKSLYARLLELNPGFTPGWINYGMLFKGIRDWGEAEACYRRAIEADAGSAVAHFNLANLLLLRQRWQEGFAEYEWRLSIPGEARPHFPLPEWTGREPEGTRVLIWGDQGYGDTIQFLRFVEQVAARGHRVFLVVKSELRDLAAAAPGVESAFGPGDTIRNADVQCSLASLPHRLGLVRSDQLWQAPYLRATPAEIPSGGGELTVGLVWAGDPRHPNDAHRSAALDALAPLLDVPRVRWYSLQLGPASAQLASSSWAGRTVDLSGRMIDFAASAAIVSALDLVVTVDTSMAHLVGALGRGGIVMLPYVESDWRWLDEGEATPWYPTLRLVRQPAAGDWAAVTKEVAAILAAKAK